MTYKQIVEATEKVLSNRDSRRDVLAARIEDVADRAMRAARVRSLALPTAGTVRWEEVSADCSQGEYDSGWPVHVKIDMATTLHVPGASTPRYLVQIDLSYHDGCNMQRQIGRLVDSHAAVIHPATVAELKAVARELPAAIAALLTEAQAAAVVETHEAEEADRVLQTATE